MVKNQTASRAICSILLAICLLFTSVSFFGCGDKDVVKKVSKIEVTALPTKTEYYVGEAFSADGAEITVTYNDNTTEKKSLSDEGVTVSEVSTQTEGTMTVTVRYGGKGARFTINVVLEKFIFTLDYHYAGMAAAAQEVAKGDKAERPADPVRDECIFDDWYADETLTLAFDFDTPINANTTVYAKWLEKAVYFDFVFDYNQLELSKPTETQKVKEGEKATRLASDPIRTGYRFEGWFTAAEGGNSYDFNSAVVGKTSVYAKWTKTVSGRNEYVFQAEDSNLKGKTGLGLSGTVSGAGLIQYTTAHGASNDRFVGYLYQYGLSLEFQFTSDVAVSDATIVIRLSAEIRDFDIDRDSFDMSINNKAIDYGQIQFVDVPKSTAEDLNLRCLPFKDYELAVNVSIKKGFNIFSVMTMNNDKTEGTTMEAIAPLIDCVKITTEAVLTWNDRLGLPKKNY